MKQVISLVLWVGWLSLLPGTVLAQDKEASAEGAEAEALGLEVPGNLEAKADLAGGSLAGLQGVCLIIQDLDPLLEEAGLDKSRVYLRVALELTRAGINIIPAERYAEFEDTAFLNVYIHSLNINGLSLAYNLGLSLSHDVSLLRNSEIITPATTWRSEELGVIQYGRIDELIDSLKAKAQEFTADYRMENPRD